MNRRDKLLAQAREALKRVEQAEQAQADAEAKLNADLEAGRDTSPARKLLHEARKFVRFANADLKRTRQAIEQLRIAETGELSESLLDYARQSLVEKIATFEEE